MLINPDFLDYELQKVLKVLAVGALFFLIERIKPAQPDARFFKKDFHIEIIYAVLGLLILLPLISTGIILLRDMYVLPYIPYQIFAERIEGWPFPLQFVMAVVLIDFFIYWRHRFTHAYMWPFHAIHHSATEISWLTKLRFHPVDIAVAIIVSAIGHYIYGFSGTAMVCAFIYIEAVDYFAHANLDFGFKGPLRYFISTPRYHRWHHAADKASYNKNFTAVFPLWDLIFGTYYYPQDRVAEKFGLSPADQKEYPQGLWGQLAWPFKRIARKLKSK